MRIEKHTHKGNRKNNDDYIYIDKSNENHIFFLIDGHGGSDCVNIFVKLFKQNFTFFESNIKNNFIKLFENINSTILNQKVYSGLCLTGIYTLKNKTFIIQLGDTKAFIYKNYSLIYETEQHDLSNKNELNRCFKYIINSRFQGKLTITRALGNYDIKKLCSMPSIKSIDNCKYDKIIMCSDGIYKKIKINSNYSSKDMIDKCLLDPPNDNMSVVILENTNLENYINGII